MTALFVLSGSLAYLFLAGVTSWVLEGVLDGDCFGPLERALLGALWIVSVPIIVTVFVMRRICSLGFKAGFKACEALARRARRSTLPGCRVINSKR